MASKSKKTESRCKKKGRDADGNKVKAKSACSEACVCGGACVDSTSWYYKKAKKDCDWVASKKTESRCKKEGRDADGDKVMAKRACFDACCGM